MCVRARARASVCVWGGGGLPPDKKPVLVIKQIYAMHALRFLYLTKNENKKIFKKKEEKFC